MSNHFAYLAKKAHAGPAERMQAKFISMWVREAAENRIDGLGTDNILYQANTQ